MADAGADVDRKPSKEGYHYWHAHGAERAAAGDVATQNYPELVGTLQKEVARRVTTIKQFAWNDRKKTVKVYIEYPQGVTGVTKENVDSSFQERAFSVTIHQPDEDFMFAVPDLRDPIVPEECTTDVREDQVVITLKKSEETTWYDLRKTHT